MTANAKFLADVTIPDNTAILAGTGFTKTWLVQNNGTVAWTPGFHLIYSSGINLAATNIIPLPPCAPGTQGQISIAMIAPTQAGKYTCNWVFRDDQGNIFGDHLFALINAQAVTNPIGQKSNYFVADITIPDDSPIEAGIHFTKTWRVRNTGTLAWNDRYSLVCMDGTLPPDQSSIVVPAVAPGGEVDLSVGFKAPTQPGRYLSDWKMKDDQGQWFGIKVWTSILVGEVDTGASGTTLLLPAPAPYYSQRDARWSSIPLGSVRTSPSIGRWGCLETCFAMLASALGHTVNPAQLNVLMIQNRAYASDYLTRWDALQLVFSDLRFDDKLGSGQATIDRIDASLQTGFAVPVQVDLTPATAYSDNDQHWVLVLGRKGEDYWVNDPIASAAPPTSLMQSYGRAGHSLADSILSAIFYHK